MRWFTDDALPTTTSTGTKSCRPIRPISLRSLRACRSSSGPWRWTPRFDLKDGRFREVGVDQQAHEVALVIDCGNLEVEDRRFTLRFVDASIEPENLVLLAKAVGATFQPDHWSPRRSVTEIHYTEVDVVPEGRFILRLRLWPFHEFGVTFGGLSINEEPQDERAPSHAGTFVSR